LIGLVMEREALLRSDRLHASRRSSASGARAEVDAAVPRRLRRPRRARALGFQELLDGDIEALKRRTRNYARRQLTWMRKLPDVEIVDVTGRSPDEVAAALR